MSRAKSKRRSVRACATSSRNRRARTRNHRRRSWRLNRSPSRNRNRNPPLNEAPPEPEAPAPGYDEDPWLEDDRDEVPADEALQPAPPRPTGEEEDVLEETPDF